jgi:hypothetical protein
MAVRAKTTQLMRSRFVAADADQDQPDKTTVGITCGFHQYTHEALHLIWILFLWTRQNAGEDEMSKLVSARHVLN